MADLHSVWFKLDHLNQSYSVSDKMKNHPDFDENGISWAALRQTPQATQEPYLVQASAVQIVVRPSWQTNKNVFNKISKTIETAFSFTYFTYLRTRLPKNTHDHSLDQTHL